MKKFREFCVKATEYLTIHQIAVKGIELGYKVKRLVSNEKWVWFWSDGEMISDLEADEEEACTNFEIIGDLEFLYLTPADVVVEPERFDFVFSRSDAGFNPCFAKLTKEQFDRIKSIMNEVAE